jgi:hypothetical protein
MSIFDCISQLAEISGFYFYIDADKDLHFEQKNTISTGLGTIATDTYDYINNLLSNPSVIITLVVIFIIYIILFISLGSDIQIPSTDTVSNSSSNTLSIIVIAFFVLLIIINGLQYFFGVDIIAKLKNILTGQPEVDIIVDTSRAEAATNCSNS